MPNKVKTRVYEADLTGYKDCKTLTGYQYNPTNGRIINNKNAILGSDTKSAITFVTTDNNNKKKLLTVHNVIWDEEKGPSTKRIVHKDNNYKNNSIDNLTELPCNRSLMAKQRQVKAVDKIGEVTTEKVYDSLYQVASAYNSNPNRIRQMCTGKTKAHFVGENNKTTTFEYV
jgi:hypothetical protein